MKLTVAFGGRSLSVGRWLTKENTIKIPVFVSMPTMLRAVHLAAKQVVLAELVSLRLEPRCAT